MVLLMRSRRYLIVPYSGSRPGARILTIADNLSIYCSRTTLIEIVLLPSFSQGISQRGADSRPFYGVDF